MHRTPASFLTGATSDLGVALLARLARARRTAFCLVRRESELRFQRRLERLEAEGVPVGRIRALRGDLTAPDLGLSHDDGTLLRQRVDEIVHLGGTFDARVSMAQAVAVNVEGTDRVLELARSIRGLHRFHFVSTTAVAGDYAHEFPEDELFVNQRFGNSIALTRFRAEAAVRKNMAVLPILVYRLGALVGDSRTGEIQRPGAPYALYDIVRRLRRWPRAASAVAPGPDQFVQMVPHDFAELALWTIATGGGEVGRSYAIVDPRPPTTFEFFALAMDHLGLPRPRISVRIAALHRALGAPVVGRVTRAALQAMGIPHAAIALLECRATFDATNADALLARAGIHCPRVTDYFSRVFGAYDRRTVSAGARLAAPRS